MATLSKLAEEFLKDTVSRYTDVAITNDYSGRSMFGQQCFGISGDQGDLDSILIDLVTDASDTDRNLKSEFKTLIKSVRKDNLGLGMIYYFPNYQLQDFCEEDDF